MSQNAYNTFRVVVTATSAPVPLVPPGQAISQVRVGRVGNDPISFPFRLRLGNAKDATSMNQGDVVDFPYGRRLVDGLYYEIPTTDPNNGVAEVTVTYASDR